MFALLSKRRKLKLQSFIPYSELIARATDAVNMLNFLEDTTRVWF